MIKTKEFSLTRGEYFSLVVRHYFARRQWAFMGCLVFLALLGAMRFDYFLIGTAVMGIGVLCALACFGYYAYAAKNPLAFSKVHYEISDNTLTIYEPDGKITSVRLAEMRQVLRAKTYYSLYFEQGRYLSLPLVAFTDEERDQFNAILKTWGH
jgi:hypothetical protein